jgi:hypothetical protein
MNERFFDREEEGERKWKGSVEVGMEGKGRWKTLLGFWRIYAVIYFTTMGKIHRQTKEAWTSDIIQYL